MRPEWKCHDPATCYAAVRNEYGDAADGPLEGVQRSNGQLVPAARVDRRGRGSACRMFQRGRRVLQFRPGFGAVHLAQGQYRVPERKSPPLVLAVAHRSQMRGATPKPLFPPIQAARQQVAPQTHAALAAAEQTRIAIARASAARSRHRIIPSSAPRRARVTSGSRTRRRRNAREASSPRMWRADAEAMRSPVKRTMPWNVPRENQRMCRRMPLAIPGVRRSIVRPDCVPPARGYGR